MIKNYDLMDKLFIRDLSLRCIIGIFDEERREKQDVIINIIIYADLKKACKSDDFNDTIDYKKIKKDIIAFAEKSSFFLIEKLAEEISIICLKDKRIQRVDITIDKPQALRFSKSAGIQITRFQDIQ
jgi:dihydroneopterin aldolase/D-erythro-7,8-dihydroneopterin triphosphate epimerase